MPGYVEISGERLPEQPFSGIRGGTGCSRLRMRGKAVKYSCQNASENQEQDDAYGDEYEVCFCPVGFAGVAAFAECPDK